MSEGVWQNMKCHQLEEPYAIVPQKKISPVLSCDVPDVFLCVQMLLYCFLVPNLAFNELLMY